MKECPKCGMSNQDDAVTCELCATRFPLQASRTSTLLLRWVALLLLLSAILLLLRRSF